MVRRWIALVIFIVVGAIAVRVMTYPDPPAENLPRSRGTAYQLIITRFSKGEGLTCPPFRLDMAFDRQPDLTRNVLQAEQGDNILVAQTPSTLYVFYSELVLNNFGGWIADTRDAQPLLCNLNMPVCAREMQRLAQAGTPMQRICGTNGKWQR